MDGAVRKTKASGRKPQRIPDVVKGLSWPIVEEQYAGGYFGNQAVARKEGGGSETEVENAELRPHDACCGSLWISERILRSGRQSVAS